MRNYWLLKTEPGSYSIEDLKRDKVGIWDGVRNYQARNNLRAMNPGDQVVIYYSSVAEPSAVGLGRVIGESFPDITQFNRKSQYFDPKAKTEKPIWLSRGIKYLKTFKKPIKLGEMRLNPSLNGMV